MADVVVRFRSCLNPWMDCVVFVPEAYQLSAIEAIRSAVEEFIKDGDVCYSDYIHSCLKEASIPYTMVISDYVWRRMSRLTSGMSGWQLVTL